MALQEVQEEKLQKGNFSPKVINYFDQKYNNNSGETNRKN